MATNTKKNATMSATEALAEARALVAKREADHAQAEETKASLIARLSRGDDTVTAFDLVTAEGEIERTSLLIEPARKAIPAAEQALDAAEARENPTLALWLSDIIKGNVFQFGLFGFDIHVVPEMPKEPATPAVYLVQQGGTKVNPATGIQAGRVGMSVIVPDGAPFPGEQITIGLAKVIDRTGQARVDSHLSQGARGSCVVDIRISGLKPTMPTLPEDVDARWVDDLAHTVVDTVSSRGGSVTHNAGNPLYALTVHRIKWALGEREIAKQVREGEQVRRTVRIRFTVSSTAYRATELVEFIGDAVGAQVDEFVPGIGRVKAARVVSQDVITPEDRPGQEFSNRPRNEKVSAVVEVDLMARVA